MSKIEEDEFYIQEKLNSSNYKNYHSKSKKEVNESNLIISILHSKKFQTMKLE